MKNFKILILLNLFIFLTSCSSDSDNNFEGKQNETISTSNNNTFSRTESNDITQLGNDEQFQLFINNEYDLIKNINDKEALNLIYSDNNLTEDELNTFYSITGFDSESSFINYYNSQLELLINLDNKYNFNKYSQEELKVILINALDQFYNNSLVSKAGPCERKLRNDMVIVAAEAYAAHLACGLADLSVIGGVICHSAVVVWHAASNDNAILDYENCIKK
jgi:hypothetical protein